MTCPGFLLFPDAFTVNQCVTLGDSCPSAAQFNQNTTNNPIHALPVSRRTLHEAAGGNRSEIDMDIIYLHAFALSSPPHGCDRANFREPVLCRAEGKKNESSRLRRRAQGCETSWQVSDVG